MLDKNRGFVYVLMSLGMKMPMFKIGKTNNLFNRTKILATQMPFETVVRLVIYSDKVYATESALHKRFHGKRLNGEWFLLTDADVNELEIMSIQSAPQCPAEFYKQAEQLRDLGILTDSCAFDSEMNINEIRIEEELHKSLMVDYVLGNF